MNPAIGVPVMMSPADSIKHMRKSISQVENFGLTLGAFLGAAFPAARDEAFAFGNAVATYMNAGKAEALDLMLNPPPPPPGYAPYFLDPTSRLVGLCKQRDQIQESLQALEGLIEKAEAQLGKNDFMAAALKLQLQAAGLPDRLQSIEEEISLLQRSIEAQALISVNEIRAAHSDSPEAK